MQMNVQGSICLFSQVIIASSWILSTLFNIPLLLAVGLDERANKCAQLFPKEWMAKATSWSWFLLPAFSTALMAFLYCRVVYNLWIKGKDQDQLTQQQMVVIRVRKRVTLMVVTVSAIFGICWCTAGTIYIVSYTAYASVDYNTAVLPISFLTVMFNSTVNPFTYALLNQQFRSKMKMIIFPACFSLSTVQPSVGGESGST
ncbi:pyroglutamylated RFamide peptide receptor-like [Stylophora pistillata]|uniref:pyroglutamylated RFamide peptide receptor-like n=1 Tax=Stylophora pistillata TaxID=50429 RepID=UPI000C043FCC|nr:pyroglutamylated RFamide peptide receptor-like [Stylophora pistillata]